MFMFSVHVKPLTCVTLFSLPWNDYSVSHTSTTRMSVGRLDSIATPYCKSNYISYIQYSI